MFYRSLTFKLRSLHVRATPLALPWAITHEVRLSPINRFARAHSCGVRHFARIIRLVRKEIWLRCCEAGQHPRDLGLAVLRTDLLANRCETRR
jgi:hypothetical protein